MIRTWGMFRVAARYHRLPLSVLVGLTCGVVVVAAGLLMVGPRLAVPVSSPAPVLPLPSSFAGIASFDVAETALPSLPSLLAVAPSEPASTALPSRPVATQPASVLPSPDASTPAPTPTVATAAPTAGLTAQPTLTTTLPPTTPAPATPAPTVIQTPPPVVTPEPTLLPAITISCGNGVDNSGGLGLICEATIFAGFTTILECHGAAGDPRAACSMRTSASRATSVDMCNGSANGGGATLRCSVTGVGFGAAPVTLCVGSGAGGTLVGMTCTWSGSSAIPVHLCNGSGNGGGALLVCAVVN